MWLLFIMSFGTISQTTETTIDKTPETFHLLGLSQYSKNYPILSQFDGQIEKSYVKAGQAINEGDPLLRLRPFDPNKKLIEIATPISGAHVIDIQLREGQTVGKHQTILTLARRSDVVIEAYALATHIAKLYIQQTVNVTLDAGGSDYPLKGVISAIHEVSSKSATPLKIEVELNVEECVKQRLCQRLLRAGVLAKIEITTPRS